MIFFQDNDACQRGSSVLIDQSNGHAFPCKKYQRNDVLQSGSFCVLFSVSEELDVAIGLVLKLAVHPYCWIIVDTVLKLVTRFY